jgi:hypothetical protein
MKAQVDEIIREVKDYISFIIEDEAKEEADITRERKVIQDPKSNKDSKTIGDTNDTQSSLIQSVLGEFFP